MMHHRRPDPLLAARRLLVLAAVAAGLPAQGFEEQSAVDAIAARAVVVVDVDGDGDLDLVLGLAPLDGTAAPMVTNRIYTNDGTGRFVDATSRLLPQGGMAARSLVAGDFDGDGHQDLVLGNGTIDGSDNRLLRNVGDGSMLDATAVNLPTDRGITAAIAAGDLDGDGDLDLVFGQATDPFGRGGQNRLFRNDGKGTFVDATVPHLPIDSSSTQVLICRDLDGDGDLDLVLGNLGAPNRLYHNDGKGHFTDVTTECLPHDEDDTLAIACGDVDGDGWPDLVIGNGGYRSHQDRLLINDGHGRFRDATVAHLPVYRDATSALLLADLDGDGDLDLVCCHYGQQDRLYLNDGAGTFTERSQDAMPAETRTTMAIAAADFDGDGDLDLVFADGGQGSRLYRNIGAGRFTDISVDALPADGQSH